MPTSLLQVTVEFKIHGSGHLYGDGMAMWVTKQRALGGTVFGAVDKFDGLGIFFDTYKNNRPGVVFPYVSAMIGDGEKSYDKENDGKAHELAGCSVRRYPFLLPPPGSPLLVINVTDETSFISSL